MNTRDHATPSRRSILSGIAITFGGLIARSAATQAKPPSPNKDSTSLHEEIELKATPQRIYEILLDAKLFATVTGLPAVIDPQAGGAFSTFGGQIVGRNVELIPGARIVQAWRPAHWDPGVYSMAHFELNPKGPASLVILDHTGFPAGEFDSLSSGWKSHYWEPLKKFLA
jgi:activator of HSP90 ATPase